MITALEENKQIKNEVEMSSSVIKGRTSQLAPFWGKLAGSVLGVRAIWKEFLRTLRMRSRMRKNLM